MRPDPVRRSRLMEHIAAANVAVANVLNLVQDNPAQIERAKNLQTLIADQSAQLRACVESVECSPADFAADDLKEVQTREGKIRTEIP